MTSDEKLVLAFLSAYPRSYPPSVQEISDELLISRSRVYSLLRQLETKGYIQKKYYNWRSLIIVDKTDE